MRDDPRGSITRRSFAQHLAGVTAGLAAPAIATSRVGPEPRRRSDHRQSQLDDLKARLPALAEYAAEAIPGFSVAAIVDGKVVWTAGYGVRKAGGNEPVTPDTVFEAASLSKPVLAYAVIRLRDEGGIDLDRPLLEYMPYPDIGEDPRAKLVTARHVLSHRTGLPNWRSKDGLAFGYAPGERFRYSGEGVFWLQRVVEHVTSAPFSQHLRERVLQPIGMERSSFVLLPEMLDNFATSHTDRNQPREGIYFEQGRKQLELAKRWNKPVETWRYEDAVRAARELGPNTPAIPFATELSPNAAASLLTTAADYARFMTRCMATVDRGPSDLSETSRLEMLTPVTNFKPALSYGLGWGLEQRQGAASFWHGGWNRGYKAFALGDTGGRTGIVLLTNSNEGDRINWPVVHGFTGRGAAALLS